MSKAQALPSNAPQSSATFGALRAVTAQCNLLREALELACSYLTDEQAAAVAAAMPLENPAAPLPAREPLTDEQIKAALTVAVQAGAVAWLGFEKDEEGRYTVPSLSPQTYQIARAIEAAHGITAAPAAKERP